MLKTILSNLRVFEFQKIMKNFIIFYSFLLLFSVPLIFLIFWRILLSLVFLVFYKGRYSLVPAEDAFPCSNKLPNTVNVNFIIFVKGYCNVDKLRSRILANISTIDNDWNIPYKLLFYTVIEKFGFHCFEDKRNSFDINYHVWICPKVEKPEQIYTESEMFSMIETTVAQEWHESRPRWEILLIPKIKKAETGEICSAVAINMAHVYGDGISLLNFIRNCVLDQPPAKLTIDPVNPPIPRVNLLQKFLLYIKVFFMGPHILLKNYGCSNEQVLQETGKLIDPSFQLFGRSKLHLSLEHVKQIRKGFNCSTQAVFHSAVNGALRKIMKRKENYSLPQEVLGGVTLVHFPYPHEYLTNRAVHTGDLMPIGIEDPVARLQETNKKLINVSKPEVLLAGVFNTKLIGILPTRVILMIYSQVKCAYYISNVPGTTSSAAMFGKQVPLIFGVGPVVKSVRTGVAVSCLNGNFYAGFLVAESELFKTRSDLDQFIVEFENELKYYVTASSR